MQTEYAGHTILVTDLATGAMHQAQIFVAVLGASNYIFAWASPTQTLPDWIEAQVGALKFFRGVPKAIDRPNQVWFADITFAPVKKGSLYLVANMDWTTRKVLSWRLSNTMHADFCVDALNEAIAKYGPPEICNMDQGSHFTGSAWITTLTDAGVRISMDGRGRLPRQRLYRAAVALPETGGDLSRRNQ